MQERISAMMDDQANSQEVDDLLQQWRRMMRCASNGKHTSWSAMCCVAMSRGIFGPGSVLSWHRNQRTVCRLRDLIRVVRSAGRCRWQPVWLR